MGAQPPKRPAPGHSMLLPRVGKDAAPDATQRAFDAVKLTTQQIQKTAGDLTIAVGSQAAGRLLAAPVVLTGSGSGTLPAGTAMIRLRGTGQGGGGGGATTGAGFGAGAGGSTGEMLEAVIGAAGAPALPSAYSWTVGSGAGGGGTSAGGNGATGADSTFTANATTYTAKGGGGGMGAVGVAANGTWSPSATATGTPAVGTSGVLRRSYEVGGGGRAFGATAWESGTGGAHEMGTGGLTVGGLTAGNPGAGAGGGGGGAAAATGGGRAGGDGAPGGWIAEFWS